MKEREKEMVWNSIRKGRLSRMTRLSIRVGGRQRISHASSFHFIPRTSSGGLPPPLSREWRGLEWFQRGRQRNGRYSSILRRFPWKTMQTRGRIPSSTQHLNRTTLVEWENRVIRPNRIVCLIQASQGTPFSKKFFKISFHRIDSCLILRSLTFNWIDVGNIVFKVFCKSGLRSDESR